MIDAELYVRGVQTLLASWEEYARASRDAALLREAGVAAAVFPSDPERGVYNNALIERYLEPAERARALDAMQTAYATAGVTRFAAWVHESDEALRADVERRGYTLDETTRAMGMTLDELRMPSPDADLAAADWAEHVRVGELPPELLRSGDHSVLHVVVGRLDGEPVATAIAFDHHGDCGIYNVGTLEHADAADSPRPSPRACCMTRSREGARRRVPKRLRWQSMCTQPRVSAISGASSNTSRQREVAHDGPTKPDSGARPDGSVSSREARPGDRCLQHGGDRPGRRT